MSRMSSQIRFLSNLTLSRIMGLVAVILLAAATSPTVQAQSKRFPVTSQMILSVMQQRQLSIDGAQVRISAPVTASVPNPMLNIETFTSLDKQNAQIRVGCRNHAECLSFYVAVTWLPQSTAQPAAHSTRSAPPVEQPQQAAVPNADLKPVTSTSTPSNTTISFTEPQHTLPARPALRVGTPLTLIIEQGRVHLSIHVISLQNGSVGDTIRVSTPDRKQVYTAEVVTPNLLKGTL